MRQDHAWPSSLSLELEAARLHAAPESSGPAGEAAAPAIGRLPLFFDLFAFALAAVMVFPRVVFANLSAPYALWAGAGLCALPLLASPAGDRLFGGLARRHGAGVSLTGAYLLLGAGSMAVSLTPGAGWRAAAFLCGVRIIQGLALGGLWRDPAPSRAPLATPIAAGLALLLAAGLYAVLSATLSPADVLAWGWRYPFLIAFALNIVGLFATLRLLGSRRPDPTGRPNLRVVGGRDA